MLTSSSKWLDYVAVARTKGACNEGLVWSAKTKFRTKTIGDIFSNYKTQILEEWGLWCLENTYNETDEQVHLLIIGLIKEPKMAFDIYIYKQHLTTAEEAALIAMFKDKLPMAEKQLISGEIKTVRT